MTTPEEHRRNIGWTVETLQDVAKHAAEGSPLHQRAVQLLQDAPTIEDIEALDGAPPERVCAVIDLLEASRQLFRDAHREFDDPDVCWAIKATLRHYPEHWHFGQWRFRVARGDPEMGKVILRAGDRMFG